MTRLHRRRHLGMVTVLALALPLLFLAALAARRNVPTNPNIHLETSAQTNLITR